MGMVVAGVLGVACVGIGLWVGSVGVCAGGVGLVMVALAIGDYRRTKVDR